MSDEIRSCQHCGKPFTVMKNGGGKKFCGKTCQIDHNKVKATERWHNVYKEARRRKRMEAKAAPKKQTESLAEVQRKAQAAGMSYGKYMLARQMGQMG